MSPRPSPSGAAARGLPFEAFEPGANWVSRDRAVAQADVDAFAALTGDHNPIHIDAAYAARTPFRTRIAHGLLVESLISGLAWDLGVFDGTIVALREVSMRFEAPVLPGDVLRLELEVLERDPAPGPRRGWVRFATRARNQRAELVLDGQWLTIVQRAAPGEPRPTPPA
ncbi:MAG: MaoC/PaaZ C-terminal domain-containing protein [Planctomycetota bacterium]|nr:MaoC/PaaZ C-terminal domain-containing protein [Planctomycetota bacterium]